MGHTNEYIMMIYRINFHLLPNKFEIGSHVNFEKLWNVNFQAKYSLEAYSNSPNAKWRDPNDEGIQTDALAF